MKGDPNKSINRKDAPLVLMSDRQQKILFSDVMSMDIYQMHKKIQKYIQAQQLDKKNPL